MARIMKYRTRRTGAFALLLLLTFVLAGCAPSNVNPDAAATQDAQQAHTPTDANTATTAARFAVFLAQGKQDEGLKKLEFGDDTAWYIPRPLLTRADLESVQARRTQQGQAFVRVQLQDDGAKRLAAVTQQYPGKLLLVTVANNLVSVVRIQQPIESGSLDIGMTSADQATQMTQALTGAE